MAKLSAFSIRDEKALVFGPPFYNVNRGVAMRQVAEAVKGDASSTMAKYPDDFTLFHVGFWDDTQGVFESSPIPERVCSVSELIG